MNENSELENIDSMPTEFTTSEPPVIDPPLIENINVLETNNTAVNDVNTPTTEVTPTFVDTPVNEINPTFVDVNPPVNEVTPTFVEVNTPVNNVNVKFDKSPKYVSFKSRLTRRIVLFVCSIVFFLIALISFKNIKTTANYKENSTADYKVCLDENEYYTEKCLAEDVEYLSEITDYINITFNYNAVFQEKTKKDYKYYVNSKILIKTVNDPAKTLLEKDKTITDIKTYSIDGNVATFVEDVDINFKEFNDYAKKYRNDYSLLSNSDLIVSLYVSDGKEYTEVSSVTIPLTKITYNISKYQVSNNDREYVVEAQLILKNIFLVITIVAAVVLLLSSISLIKFFLDTRNKTTEYQKKLNQILSTYDRVIVSLKDSNSIVNSENVYKVNSFLELLDVRDTINKPILYHKVNNIKTEFYVQDVDKVYKYTMKESDFE